LNSYLNSVIFAGVSIMLIPFGCCEMTITPIIHLKQVFYKALYYILVFYSK
jgi:hypothetical protein